MRFIIAYDVLQIFALIIISAILCTAWFSSSIRRSTTWYSFNFAWLLSCIGSLLIPGHQTGPLPGHIHCLFQATLVFALPALNALSFVVLTLDVFLSLSHLCRRSRTTMMMILCFVPYGVFTGILIEVLILGPPPSKCRSQGTQWIFLFYIDPGTVGLVVVKSLILSTTEFCRLLITSIIVICSVVACLILGVRIGRKCRSHWMACEILLIRNNTPFGLVLRLGVFGLCSILSIGLGIIEIFEWNKVFSISSAMLPVAVGIIFGSQGDMLHVWMFWRKPLPTPTTATV
ncbi:hypothetical protein BYT27DRAFT_6483839 [Phlegmacium glaucopus]|nr:hypothetical protein BYT27DRAFT_6483839 [Phlegmacium glaucopus]